MARNNLSGTDVAVAGIIGLIMIVIGLGIGYMIWVGIFLLINTVFATTINIWWGGLFGIIAVQVLKGIFGGKK